VTKHGDYSIQTVDIDLKNSQRNWKNWFCSIISPQKPNFKPKFVAKRPQDIMYVLYQEMVKVA